MFGNQHRPSTPVPFESCPIFSFGWLEMRFENPFYLLLAFVRTRLMLWHVFGMARSRIRFDICGSARL